MAKHTNLNKSLAKMAESSKDSKKPPQQEAVSESRKSSPKGSKNKSGGPSAPHEFQGGSHY